MKAQTETNPGLRRCWPKVVLALGLAVAAAAAAVAQDPMELVFDGSVVSIAARHSQKRFDVEGMSEYSGAPVNQWREHSGQNQDFRLARDDGRWRLIAMHSGMCLEIAGSGEQAELAQGRCYDHERQRFSIEYAPTDRHFVRIVSGQDYCLEVYAGSYEDGAPIIQSHCEYERPHQDWFLYQATK